MLSIIVLWKKIRIGKKRYRQVTLTKENLENCSWCISKWTSRGEIKEIYIMTLAWVDGWFTWLVASLTHILFCSWGHLEESQNIQKHPLGSSRKSTGAHVARLQTDIGQRLWKAEWCQHQTPPLQWGFHLPSLSPAVRNHFTKIK